MFMSARESIWKIAVVVHVNQEILSQNRPILTNTEVIPDRSDSIYCPVAYPALVLLPVSLFSKSPGFVPRVFIQPLPRCKSEFEAVGRIKFRSLGVVKFRCMIHDQMPSIFC